MAASTLLNSGLASCAYVFISILLIGFNKWILHEERYPHPRALVTGHMIFCTLMSFFLYCAFPTLYPALLKADQKSRKSFGEVFSEYGVLCIPIAICFSITLVCSNMAYTHVSVSFCQMLKEVNVVFIYGAALMLAAEKKFSFRIFCTLVCLVLATLVSIHGEINFVLMGLVLQLSGQIGEVLKITLQSLLLAEEQDENKSRKKLDPLSFVLIISPLSALVLVPQAVFFNLHQGQDDMNNLVRDATKMLPYLICNLLVAFAINLAIAFCLKYTTPTSFTVVGVVKDMLVVLMSAALLRDPISPQQCISFPLQCFLVLIYSLIRIYPQEFEEANNNFFLTDLWRVICTKVFNYSVDEEVHKKENDTFAKLIRSASSTRENSNNMTDSDDQESPLLRSRETSDLESGYEPNYNNSPASTIYGSLKESPEVRRVP